MSNTNFIALLPAREQGLSRVFQPGITHRRPTKVINLREEMAARREKADTK